DHSEYHKHVRRLGDYQRRQLDDPIIHFRKMTRFQKVMFFQKISVFEDIPGLTLSYLADICEEIRMKTAQTLVLDEKSSPCFYVIVTGSIHLHQRGAYTAEFTQGQFIGEMLALPNIANTNVLIAQSDVVILKFNKEQFYELL